MSEKFKLSKRQVQLIDCLSRGLNNLSIAQELGISEHTVKVHMWRMFKKLGVKSRTQALIKAKSLNGANSSQLVFQVLSQSMYLLLQKTVNEKFIDFLAIEGILQEYRNYHLVSGNMSR